MPEDWIPVARAMRCSSVDFSDLSHGANVDDVDVDDDADDEALDFRFGFAFDTNGAVANAGIGAFNTAARDRDPVAKSVAERRIVVPLSLSGISILSSISI